MRTGKWIFLKLYNGNVYKKLSGHFKFNFERNFRWPLYVCACIPSLYSNIFTHHTLHTCTFTSMPLSRYCAYIESRKTLVMIKDRSLSILIWASLSDSSLPGKWGQLEGRVSFSFGTGRVILLRSVTSWLGRQEPSISLSAICLVFVFGSSLMGDVGDGGWGGCLITVN